MTKSKQGRSISSNIYFSKRNGYHHNFTRGLANLNNIGQVSWSGHSQNLPSNSSSTTSNASGNSTTPAAPMAPAPTVIQPKHPQHPQRHPATQVPDPVIHVLVPLTTPNKSPSFAIVPKYPHKEAYITSNSQLKNHYNKAHFHSWTP